MSVITQNGVYKDLQNSMISKLKPT